VRAVVFARAVITYTRSRVVRAVAKIVALTLMMAVAV
jgi:hypothetical protein